MLSLTGLQMNITMELRALWFVRRDLKFEQAWRKSVQKKGFLFVYVCKQLLI